MDDLVKPTVSVINKAPAEKIILDRIEKKYGHRAENLRALYGDENLEYIERILDYNWKHCGIKREPNAEALRY
jgi:hypothetical protein